MRIAVIGSRNFTNYTQMAKYLAAKSGITSIVTGCAKGADALAKVFAANHNIPVQEYPQDKISIVENCDAVMAFWDGKSPNTQEVLKLAKKMHKPIEVIFLEKRENEPAFGYISL